MYQQVELQADWRDPYGVDIGGIWRGGGGLKLLDLKTLEVNHLEWVKEWLSVVDPRRKAGIDVEKGML